MHKYLVCYETCSKWNGTPVLNNTYHQMSGLTESNIAKLRQSLYTANPNTVSITFVSFTKIEPDA